MKFVCPVCKSAGDLPEDHVEEPVTKTTCRNCAAILLINPDSGKVEAYTHKPALEDSAGLTPSSLQQDEKASSVLSLRSRDKESRDWLAIGVVVVVLIILIATGIYFAFNLDIFQKPLSSVSEMVKDIARNENSTSHVAEKRYVIFDKQGGAIGVLPLSMTRLQRRR